MILISTINPLHILYVIIWTYVVKSGEDVGIEFTVQNESEEVGWIYI